MVSVQPQTTYYTDKGNGRSVQCNWQKNGHLLVANFGDQYLRMILSLNVRDIACLSGPTIHVSFFYVPELSK